MALHEYHRKRDFQRSPEPRGGAPRSPTGRLYVIQKHAATRMHYDLRLEIDGALVSWAVPKGPSLDPREKRLAVHVEDHPIEYGDFEGVIPEGHYGAGTVMLWDRGEWFPLDDPKEHTQLTPQEGLQEGKLKFELRGQKLRGGFMLVRIKNPEDKADNWLLMKERDREQRPLSEYDILDDAPFSVATNRSIREIAQDKDNIWTPHGAEGKRASVWLRRRAVAPAQLDLDPQAAPGARPLKRALTIKPIEPVPADEAPEGDDWLHEIGVIGERLICALQPGTVALWDEAGVNWASRLPEIARDISLAPFDTATLDGVLVALNASGASDPRELALALESGARERLRYHVFDLVTCDGVDLRNTPLVARKELLRAALGAITPQPPTVTAVEHIRGRGPQVLAQARKLGVSGLRSRRADSPYPSRKTRDWLLIADSAEAPAPAAAPPAATTERKTLVRAAAKKRASVVVEPRLEIGGVRLTNPDRILYPEERVTKRDLAVYYERVGDLILPHIARRPLSLFRCPNGWEKGGFFQKHMNEYESPYLRTSAVREGEGKEPYIALDDLRGLLTLAQLAVLEIHPWGCREDNIEKPDRLIFDLDPGPDVTWPHVVEGALAVREVLDALGLKSFVKTSGGKGLHVVSPIDRTSTWDEVKRFAELVAKRIVKLAATRYTATMTKSRRPGKVFIDYFRNHRGTTCVGPYSTRARAGAPVSTPIAWKELGERRTAFSIATLLERLADDPRDPWAGFFDVRQAVTRQMIARLE